MQITQKKFGFTVIEVAVVIGIISLAAGAYFLSKNKAGADVVTKGVVVMPLVGDPIFSPLSGTGFLGSTSITLRASTTNQFIKYNSSTTSANPAIPSLSSTSNTCMGTSTTIATCKINLTSSTKIAAIAYWKGTTTANIGSYGSSALVQVNYPKVSLVAPLMQYGMPPVLPGQPITIEIAPITNPTSNQLEQQLTIKYTVNSTSNPSSTIGTKCPSTGKCYINLPKAGTNTIKALEFFGTQYSPVKIQTFIGQ